MTRKTSLALALSLGLGIAGPALAASTTTNDVTTERGTNTGQSGVWVTVTSTTITDTPDWTNNLGLSAGDQQALNDAIASGKITAADLQSFAPMPGSPGESVYPAGLFGEDP